MRLELQTPYPLRSIQSATNLRRGIFSQLYNLLATMALQSLFAIGLASFAAAHSGHQNSKAPEVDPNASWMAKHMAGT